MRFRPERAANRGAALTQDIAVTITPEELANFDLEAAIAELCELRAVAYVKQTEWLMGVIETLYE